MAYVDKRLLQASKDNSKLCTVDGESVVATYLSYEVVKNEQYNSMSYLFKFRTEDGSVKTIKTKMRKFLATFARIPFNSKVQITGFNLSTTKEREYEVEILSKPKMAAAVEGEQQVEEEQVEEVVAKKQAEESADDEEILFA